MGYLLSIIVPTKNRYKYLKSIIETFTLMDNGEIEFVIQDNSDVNKEILQLLSLNNSPNIKYFYYSQQLSVSDNFSIGIYNSTGLFVCMLGDDDTVSSKIGNIVHYMEANKIESALFNRAYYYWPDMEFRSHKMPSLIIPKCTGKIKIIDPQLELNKCLKRGATSLFNLPEIYHGIISREVLDKVYEHCNTYFPGASPDMAIAIPLSLTVKSHVYVDAPYTFSGQAYVSAGGKGARHQHKGKLKDMKWLPDDIEDNWETNIPMVWTGATIYAESAHKALRAMGRDDLLGKFNYPYHYAYFTCFETEYVDILKSFLKGKPGTKVIVFLYSISILLMRISVFVKNIINIKLKITNNITYENVKTSSEASRLVDDYINSQLPEL